MPSVALRTFHEKVGDEKKLRRIITSRNAGSALPAGLADSSIPWSLEMLDYKASGASSSTLLVTLWDTCQVHVLFDGQHQHIHFRYKLPLYSRSMCCCCQCLLQNICLPLSKEFRAWDLGFTWVCDLVKNREENMMGMRNYSRYYYSPSSSQESTPALLLSFLSSNCCWVDWSRSCGRGGRLSLRRLKDTYDRGSVVVCCTLLNSANWHCHDNPMTVAADK